MAFGVTDALAIGVIARLANPTRPQDSAVGVWGCRSESTLATAHYLRSEFKSVVGRIEHGKPLVMLLAVRGAGLNVCKPMLAVTDRVLFRSPELLALYQRPDAPVVVSPAD
jgi:hypothetical protein